jgi:Kunitz/Bovine pancreatic trypsin inhibitor domain
MRRFFSPSALQCQLFAYGGCQGNGNRFDTLEQCTGNCTGTAPAPSQPAEMPPPPVEGKMSPPEAPAEVTVPANLRFLLEILGAAACLTIKLYTGCCSHLLDLQWRLSGRYEHTRELNEFALKPQGVPPPAPPAGPDCICPFIFAPVCTTTGRDFANQ